ncbi:hypothetical protein TFLX_00706 [Thermoflexales bacterium]|nr:hypothetical protein TFLX_00706 [Thermoflexales bacterium]
MKLSRLSKSNSLLAALAAGTLLIAVFVAQGATADSSAAQFTVTRQPRPHPQSHLKSSEPGGVTLHPRPHPKSHIRATVTETLLNQP